MNKSILYIKHASSHHARHSGYAKLLDYIPGKYLPDSKPMLAYRVRKAIASLASVNAGIYNSDSVHKEGMLVKHLLLNQGGIAHFLNGERDIRYSTFLKKWRNWNFVATFHKPPSIINSTITNYKYLSRLDGAIAVGKNQIDFLKEKLKTEAVEYIPHGVDTSFFTPGDVGWKQNTCLFVGQHLRDFETLGKTIELIKRHIPNFKLQAVLRQDVKHLLPNSSNIEVFSGISDEQLRNLYRTSAALLLPLKDSTACNSILEALACGLPIVTNDVGGVKGYLDESCGFLVKERDAKAMADAAIYLMKEETFNHKIRQNCRLRSLEYSWETIANSIIEYYKVWFNHTKLN